MTIADIEDKIEECTTIDEMAELFSSLADEAIELNNQTTFTESYIVEHYGENALDDILVDAFSTIDREDAFENGIEPPYPEIDTPSVDAQTNETLTKFFGLEV